jgi:trehalose 6-phosphate synthase/phosphatase
MGTNGAGPSQRLIVVSNRLPLTLQRHEGTWRTERSSGGLATALWPMLQRTDGLWIGWPGERATGDPGIVQQLERWRLEKRCLAVDLQPDVAERFYEGYANQTLWPLFHQFPLDLHYEAAEWDAYVDANRAFRDAVLREARPGDRVWVHDYHLLLLPQLLREACSASCPGERRSCAGCWAPTWSASRPTTTSSTSARRWRASWASTAAWTGWR